MPSQNPLQMTWKQSFTDVFVQTVSQRFQIQANNAESAYKIFDSSSGASRTSFWRDVAEILHITNKQAHDYFHNVWSRHYCDEFTEFKDELKMIGTKFPQLSHRERVNASLLEFSHRHPEKRFHYQQLYQYLNYQLAHHLDENSSSYAQSFGDSGDDIIPFTWEVLEQE